MQEGLVIRTTGSWYRVLVFSEQCSVFSGATQPIDNQLKTKHLTLNTQAVDCRLRGNYRLRGNKQPNPVAVGDRVLFEMQDDGTGIIHEVQDRRNYIVRRATKLSKQTHVIAANIDLLCIVATLGLPRTSTGFIDRLLVTAEAYHIPAAILFNKSDLISAEVGSQRSGLEDASDNSALRTLTSELVNMYRSVGYPVLEISALTGQGLDKVRTLIAGKTVLFSGHSGVGKSALLNALCPGLDLRTGDLSDWSLKGKHTTTFAEIFPVTLNTEHLTLNTYLIDTPGIKEFGMVDFNAQELSHFFPEMRAVLHDCRFANCTHRHEPGCAVMQAVDDGRIPAERYHNYLNILESVESI